jgi:diaminopropionate ammonia-lyase
VAGESGGVGLAGLIRAIGDRQIKAHLRLGDQSRVLVINTEGATDPLKYEAIVGEAPGSILSRNAGTAA